jgi:CRP-like cAMP-binding protein
VGVPALAHSPRALADALRREGSVKRFARGQTLFIEGDRSARVFMIERGSAIVFCTVPAGRDVVLAVRGPGDVLGDLSALDDGPRFATAVALDEVEAVVAPPSSLVRSLDDVDAVKDLVQTLVDRLREADRRRLEFATRDTLGRVATRLLELAGRFGVSTPEGTVVDLPISQDQLASWCAASRESTVKALGTLRGLGCIATSRRRFVVLDSEALSRYAGDSS